MCKQTNETIVCMKIWYAFFPRTEQNIIQSIHVQWERKGQGLKGIKMLASQNRKFHWAGNMVCICYTNSYFHSKAILTKIPYALCGTKNCWSFEFICCASLLKNILIKVRTTNVVVMKLMRCGNLQDVHHILLWRFQAGMCWEIHLYMDGYILFCLVGWEGWASFFPG